jgi:putative membrane protein
MRLTTRTTLLAGGLLTLGVAWLGPLPQLARDAFYAHMIMHMAVVAVAAPLLAVGIAGGRYDPARAAPGLFAPIPASIVELVIVWLWHTPVLHYLARHHGPAFLAEQGSFLAAGFFLWLAAAGGTSSDVKNRSAAGVVGLLMTAMHMTLLGALLALAPRPLYGHAPGAGALTALDDQHLGGAIMILMGGVSYLLGGLWLTWRLLRGRVSAPVESQ